MTYASQYKSFFLGGKQPITVLISKVLVKLLRIKYLAMIKSKKYMGYTFMTLHIIGGVVYFFGQSDQTTIEVEMANIKPIKIVKNNDHTHADSLRVYHLPSKVEDHQIVERPYYTFSYNNDHEQADWVAYKMYPFPDSLAVKRKDAFRPDPMVKKGSASLADYLKSGYDRGHLAPAKALSYSKESMKASFFLSNMSPQASMFNRGIWRFLEAQVYQWSKESDSLYLVTGPVLDHPIGIIGKNNVSVPRSYYKTIVRFKDNKITGIGFLLKNEKTKDSFFKFATSIDSIEQVTGIDFYEQTDDKLEARFEQNKHISVFIDE